MITVNGKKINFKEGMTAADAVMAAGESVDGVTLVVIDGVVLPCGQLPREPLSDGTEIKLLSIISGG